MKQLFCHLSKRTGNIVNGIFLFSCKPTLQYIIIIYRTMHALSLQKPGALKKLFLAYRI